MAAAIPCYRRDWLVLRRDIKQWIRFTNSLHGPRRLVYKWFQRYSVETVDITSQASATLRIDVGVNSSTCFLLDGFLFFFRRQPVVPRLHKSRIIPSKLLQITAAEEAVQVVVPGGVINAVSALKVTPTKGQPSSVYFPFPVFSGNVSFFVLALFSAALSRAQMLSCLCRSLVGTDLRLQMPTCIHLSHKTHEVFVLKQMEGMWVVLLVLFQETKWSLVGRWVEIEKIVSQQPIAGK